MRTGEGLECTALYRPTNMPETRGVTLLIGVALNNFQNRSYVKVETRRSVETRISWLEPPRRRSIEHAVFAVRRMLHN